ncbi:MAG: glycoside hydrolase family 3 C-terminal domain-containing protein [Marinilabiliaceae bacterium]|nr:glycoside hydrolase family 3 C-terminal domain-containing protein [Marinilabiliaceae bacterium]
MFLKINVLYGLFCLIIAFSVLLSCRNNNKVGVSNNDILLNYDSVIDSIITTLSLKEKINMLHGNGKFSSGGIGRIGISELHYTDGPLGIREEIERDSWEPAGWTTDSATFFPAGTALGATWNPDVVFECGKAMGREARARNKDVLLVPAINILRSPLNGRNYEYFTEDPFLNKTMVVPYVKGVQSEDVAACVKHFAVNNQETNRGSVDVSISERALREIYLPGFKAAVVKGQCFTVMGAYNRLRGDYLCENDYMLNHILKKEWGFNGAVVSDWGAVHSTVKAANSGLDVEMGTDVRDYNHCFFADPLYEAVVNGKVKESVVDEKVRRVLRVVYGIKKNMNNRSKGAINTPEHSKIVYNAACEAVVLLKNENKILPVDVSKTKSIAVIGDNSTRTFGSGGFGAGVKSQYEITPLMAIKNKLGKNNEISYAQGYREKYVRGKNDDVTYGRIIDYSVDEMLIKEAVEIARKSDYALIFAGANRHTESEAVDREDMRLPFAQETLIKEVASVNPRTIVILTVGTPYDIKTISKMVPSLLISWFMGAEAGNAICDLLTGKVNPSGKLPFTIPARLEDSPAHALGAYPGSDRLVEYKEDIFVGYRWFDKQVIDPLYCFGYGLSYTSFDVSDVKLEKKDLTPEDTLSLRIKISNVGDYDGAEVLQVYYKVNKSKIERSIKELCAFKKVFIPSGHIEDVEFRIPVNELSFFNHYTNKWEVEKGQYNLLVSNSSRSVFETVSILVF